MVTEVVEPEVLTSSEVNVYQSAPTPVHHGPSSLIALSGTLDEIVAAQDAYQEVCRKLLDANDIQVIGQKEFKKRSAWNKLSVAFGVSTEVLRTTHERNERGRIIRTECVVRATAPNGRFSDGIGACDLYERCCEPETCNKSEFWANSGRPTGHSHCSTWPCKTVHFSNPQHDIPATAMTRASNRAKADLFGMGEVSAEEMSDDGNGHRAQDSADQPGQPRSQAIRPASDAQVKFVNDLLGQTGRDAFDLKELIGREVVVANELSSEECKKVIDLLKDIRDGKTVVAAPAATVPEAFAKFSDEDF